MSSPESKVAVEAYGLYFGVLVLMVTAGVALQSTQLHLGLILSGVVCILLPGVVVRHLRRKAVRWPSLTKLGMRWPWLIWVALTAALVGIAANIFTGILVELVPALQETALMYEQMVEDILRPDDPLLMAVGIFAVVVSAPVCEEFLFRGVMLPMQRTADLRTAWVLLANGLLFGLLHLNPMGFLALTAVGVFFAHLVVLTDSLWPPIVAHATLNAVNGVVVPWALRQSDKDPVEPALTELLAAAALVVPLVALVWWMGARQLDAQRDARSS